MPDTPGSDRFRLSGRHRQKQRHKIHVPAIVLLLAIGTIVLLLVSPFAYRALDCPFYDPESRIPPPASYPFEEGFFGANSTIAAGLLFLEAAVADTLEVNLRLQGPVYKLNFPRNPVDTLCGKRNENAVVFAAETPAGLRFQFLVIHDRQSPKIFAVQPLPLGDTAASDIEGIYIELPPGLAELDSSLAKLRAGLEMLMPDVLSAESQRLDSSDYRIFGPFTRSDDESKRLAALVRGNIVVAHLTDSLEAAKGDVTVGAPAYSLQKTQAKAIYLPAGLAQRPLWGSGDVDESLGHELTHAYVDRVLPVPEELLPIAEPYFARNHPKLHGLAVPLFYGEVINQSDVGQRVEESLAFIVGALANRRSYTTHTIVLPDKVLLITEQVLASDIDLLVVLGLLPDCMGTEQTGFTREELLPSYFGSADESCHPSEH